MNQLLILLNNLNFTIGWCESITSIAGVSKYFNGGFITYTNETKINIVKVKVTIEKYGAISKKCAINGFKYTKNFKNKYCY